MKSGAPWKWRGTGEDRSASLYRLHQGIVEAFDHETAMLALSAATLGVELYYES